MVATGAIAWMAGLSSWLAIALGLVALSAGVLVTARAGHRGRRASPGPMAVRNHEPNGDGDFDPEEMITQDANSGRIWRIGDVHFLGAAEKRRLATERPQVWRAYRARVFPLPQAPVSPNDDGRAPGADGVGPEQR